MVMPASLATLTSQTAAAPGAVSAAARIGLAAGSTGDVTSAFAGLIDSAQAADGATTAGSAIPSPSDARQGAAVDPPSVSMDAGASLPAASTLPAALLSFLAQAQGGNDGGGASSASTGGGAAANDTQAALGTKAAPLTAANPSFSPAAQPKAPPKLAARTPLLTASTAATATAALLSSVGVAAQTNDPAPAKTASDAGEPAAKTDRDKADASLQTPTPTPLPVMLVGAAPSPIASPSGGGSGAGQADTIGMVAGASLPAPSASEALSEPAVELPAPDVKGAANAQAIASAANAQALSSSSLKAESDARPTAAAASLNAGGDTTAPATATAASSPVPPASPSDAPSPITAATSAAAATQAGASASASAASSSARFATPKSTAATSFRAAPTGARSASAAQAGASGSIASVSGEIAPSGEHASLSSGDAHADDLIGATTGDGASSADADGSAIPSDVAFQTAAVTTDMAASTTGPAPGAPAAGSGAETAANLSAQIVQKLAGQNTRFDLQLNPNGLGRVDVAVQIDAKGALSASLSFEKPEAASLLRAHAGDLQQSLTQAGFDLSNASLSFSTADQNGRGSQQSFFAGNFGGDQNADQGGQGSSAGRAFNAASLAAAQADTIAVQSQGLSARGVDIRI